MVDLEMAIQEGVSLRSKWGLRFSRAADGAKDPGYKGTQHEKAAFRKAWCNAKMAELRREQVHMQEHKKIDERVGTYRPMSIIYEHQ